METNVPRIEGPQAITPLNGDQPRDHSGGQRQQKSAPPAPLPPAPEPMPQMPAAPPLPGPDPALLEALDRMIAIAPVKDEDTGRLVRGRRLYGG